VSTRLVAETRTVVEIPAEFCQLQRMERVAHHRKLMRLVRPDRLGPRGPAGGRAAGGRMQRDRADVDAAPRAELAGDVIDHLLRLQIGVVYGIRTASGSKSSLRGRNEQITKLRPWKV
jgi:hypothetical protein